MTGLATIEKAINDSIDNYINTVSSKYGIDSTELQNLWINLSVSGNTSPHTTHSVDCSSHKTTVSSTNSTFRKNLESLKKPDLQELCKSKGIKTKGTKQVLIDLLLDTEGDYQQVSPSADTNGIPKKEITPVKKVIKKISTCKSSISIRQNQFGNYEHMDTCFVFDSDTQFVIGKQNTNGSIDPLTKDDIDTCNQYKFNYDLPDNLSETRQEETQDEGEEDDEDIEDEELLQEEEDEDDDNDDNEEPE